MAVHQHILANTMPKEFRQREITLHYYKTWREQSRSSTLSRMEPTIQICRLSSVSVGYRECRVKLPPPSTGDLRSSGKLHSV